jgi:hypothetical protein
LFGSNPLGYHAATLLIHVINVMLVFRAAKTLLRHSPGAFMAALFYACAVLVHSEALYFVAVVNELLMTAFLLLSFWMFLRWRQGQSGRGALVISLFSFGLALLCKESSVTYPAILFVYQVLAPREAARGVRGRIGSSVRATWPFWVLGLSFVGLRLPAIVAALGSGSSRYEYTFGLWVLTKYYWGLKWLFEVFLAPLQRLTSTLPDAIPVDRLLAVAVALGAAAGLAYYAWGLVRYRRAVPGWAPVVLGLVWYFVTPLSVIFSQPFAAYFFMVPGFGIHLAAGRLTDWVGARVESLARGGRVAFFGVLTLVSLVSALWQSRLYTQDPQWIAQQGRLSREVVNWMARQSLDYAHAQQVYLVGFPSDLFAMGGEAARSADTLELYLGHRLAVTQISTMKELPGATCAGSLVFAYDADELMRLIQLPGCEAT